MFYVWFCDTIPRVRAGGMQGHVMTAKKWFSENDVNAARERLSALPDLARERLTRAEVLGQLRDDIRTLHRKKGYTLPELRKQLESVGLTVSEKTLRDLLDGGRPARRRTNSPAVAEEKKAGGLAGGKSD